MLDDLKLGKRYDGLLYLAQSTRNLPRLHSHHHVELELNLVVRGTVTYIVRGQRYSFPARTLLWLFPEQEHQLVDRSEHAENYVAVFKPSLIRKACRSDVYKILMNKHNHDGVLSTLLDPASFDLIRKTMDAMMQDALDADVLNRNAGFGVDAGFSFEHGDPDGLNAGLRHLLLLCWRSQNGRDSQGNPVTLHRVVRRALRLLSEGTEGQDLKAMAGRCGCSEAYLSRTFHRQVGVPLSRYRNTLRLSRFWERINRSQTRNLTEAVYAAGFGSYPQFYKVFKQVYGCGPRECRANRTPQDRALQELGARARAASRTVMRATP